MNGRTMKRIAELSITLVITWICDALRELERLP